MLDLVRIVQQDARSDGEVVAKVKRLVRSGAVLLGGSFAGERL